MIYKGFEIKALSTNSGWAYTVNGERSIVSTWGDDISAYENAKHDIDQGYWSDLDGLSDCIEEDCEVCHE